MVRRWVLWPERNARIHYVAQGTRGPCVLLVHGFGVGEYHFERNVGELARNHRVWAIDLLGQGASWPLAPVERSAGLQYSLDTWTEQLAFFVREVIQESGGVYVAGNSLGGLLAVTLAYGHPEVGSARTLLLSMYVGARPTADMCAASLPLLPLSGACSSSTRGASVTATSDVKHLTCSW